MFMSKRTQGILLALLASFLFGVEPSIRTYALQRGVPAESAMTVTSLTTFILYAAVCLMRRERLRLPLRQAVGLAATGMIGLYGTTLLLSLAYFYIPVGCATVIHFLYPSLVSAAAALLFHRRLSPSRILAMICSVAGLFCIVGGGLGGAPLGVLLALGSSLTYTFYLVILEKAMGSGMPLSVKMFYLMLGAMLVSVAPGLRSGWSGPGLSEIAALLLCGGMYAAATFAFAAGVERIGAGTASFLSIFEPLTSLAVSTLWYRSPLTAMTTAGCGLSLLAVFLSVRERRPA